jgi:hypothetical protein
MSYIYLSTLALPLLQKSAEGTEHGGQLIAGPQSPNLPPREGGPRSPLFFVTFFEVEIILE